MKAKKYLDEKQITYNERHIKDNPLCKEEIMKLHTLSGIPLKKFFNTSGLVYRELQLKDKLPLMSEEEQYTLLASNGMLVKRPILVYDNQVIIGYKPAEYEKVK